MPPETRRPPSSSSQPSQERPLFDLIELFYFAYRDFVDAADRLLESYRFGRAHHRVLYFIARRPGLTVAELLDILQITKQSLNRVLKELLEESFVEARTGAQDRRQRLLFATPAGEALIDQLARLQSGRFERALKECAAACGAPSEAAAQQRIETFFRAMIEPNNRAKILSAAHPSPRAAD